MGERFVCKECGYEIDARQIPVGDKYEVACPKCEMMLFRRRRIFL